MNTLKILKKLVSEGYSLKAHHNNNQWKEALENGELLIQELSKLHQPTVIKSVCESCKYFKSERYHDKMWCIDCQQNNRFEKNVL